MKCFYLLKNISNFSVKITEVDFERVNGNNGILNAKVLLLNQSYEPLSLCNVKKAVILMYLGKAEVVAEKKGKFIRSVSLNLRWPTVIRLNSYVKVPFQRVMLNRKNILKRDGYKCAYCGRSDLPLTIDHVIPRSKGGKETWENLVTACYRCNNKKGDRTPNEAGMPLLIKPYRPSHIMFIKNSVNRIDEAWKPFLFQD